jgi:adenine deaminase
MIETRQISGNIVDLINKNIYPGTLEIASGRIVRIARDAAEYDTCLIPGLIDSHIHIESSLLTPAEFARLAVVHGTVATLSDPHEMANVLGVPGIDYMLENSRLTPFKFYFGVPSAVPATDFELSGATLDAGTVDQLLGSGDFRFLAEVMNIPGVLGQDPQTAAKLAAARKYGLPVDGHAPGLSGSDLYRYIQAGITTDHEASDLQEALEKIGLGMKIQIREGSAAANFDALHPLLQSHSEHCMFCSDDRHPNHLVSGHINEVVRRALRLGYDPFNVLRCASLNPIRHYQLDVGLLREGDPADFAVIDNLTDFTVLQTYIQGIQVAERGRTLLPNLRPRRINNFQARPKRAADFAIRSQSGPVNVIEVIEGQLLTGRLRIEPTIQAGAVIADPQRDLLKLAVVNRYRNASPAVALIRNIGLQKGAIAASVAHDSHNIIAAGVSDADLAAAVNLVIENRGGFAIASGAHREALPLPVAGLMSDADGYQVAETYAGLLQTIRELGSALHDPFMTLGFMSLPVIPDLKLTAGGLFDVPSFRFIDLFET